MKLIKNYIFFQSCVSPHQVPFLLELSKIKGCNKVKLISPIIDYENRNKLGWNGSKYLDNGQIDIIINPTDDEIIDLYKKFCNEYSVFVYSGINGFPDVAHWLKLSIKYNIKRCLITEAPYVYKKPIWMHKIRFALQDLKYVKYFEKVFLMGDKYINYYKFWNKKWDVIPFMYSTEWNEITKNPHQGILKLLFVGALINRKHVDYIFNEISYLSKEEQNKIEIGIIGDGEKLNSLEYLSKKILSKTTFYGRKKMEEIVYLMQDHDILILPSFHDGWGAVVNEALILGLYVMCSDRCGACFLIKNDRIGKVFSLKKHSLKRIIGDSLKRIEVIRNDKNYRINWSKDNISPKAIADYFFNKINK